MQLDKLFEKPPPQAPEAEMALLGAMILDPRVTGDVIQVVRTAGEFYSAAHGAVFKALVDLYDRHQSGDLVQLVAVLRDQQALNDIGGPAYLEKLAAETPGTAGAVHWAQIVAEKAKLRKLISTAGQIVYDAYNSGQTDGTSAGEILDRAEQQIFEIAEQDQTSDPQKLGELLEREFHRLQMQEGQGLLGLRTGFDDLDEMLSGFQAGEMVILAARPSMGKSALMMNLAEQIALGGPPHAVRPGDARAVGVFSMEMSKSAIVQRLLSARSGVSTDKMRSGQLGAQALARIGQAADELSSALLLVDDSPGLTVLTLRARARRMVAQHGVKCLFIDYLQLMTAPGRTESRQVEVSAISRGIKALARELNVPVICLSQLNRGPESRGDNRPRMSDLRESGSIEQDADVVMLLHREEYYHIGDPAWENDTDNDDKKGMAEVIIAKQRTGPTGSVKLRWDSNATRFRNYTGSRGGGGYGGGDGFGGGGSGVPVPMPPSGRGPAPITPAAAGPASHQGGFHPGRKTGPIEGHRDGGGPDRGVDDEDTGGVPF